MDEKAAIRAVAALMDDNKAVLIAGITQAGQARDMEAVHKTVLGSIVEYYTIKVNCTRARHAPMRGVSNINSGRPYTTHYEIQVHVADNALMEQNEDDSFLNAHESFRVFTDRIVNLFATSTEWIPDVGSGKAFRLPPTDERIVTKENLNPMEDPETSMPILGATISFTIVGCND